MSNTVDGIVLLSKQSGITSFSSLWQIKNALETKKIGHTGTLDTFADGLLVALTGRLTHLASFITDCDKEYLASISFGSETDTLDPDGTIIRETSLPVYSCIKSVLPGFCGSIMQCPPVYSALHIDGQRASDRIRKGEILTMPERPVTINDIDIFGAYDSNGCVVEDSSLIARLDIRVSCSKGTYIRSLARDIAIATGSSGYLLNLRRTKIGPFRIEDSAGFSMLSEFGLCEPMKYGKGDKPPVVPSEEIKSKRQPFTRKLATCTDIYPVELLASKKVAFCCGQKLEYSWFTQESVLSLTNSTNNARFSVFCTDNFLGVLSNNNSGLAYEFVIGDPA